EMKVYSEASNLKYDLIVKPGVSTNIIKIEFEGVAPYINETGDLVINTSVSNAIENKPYCYQIIDGVKYDVAANYKLLDNVLTFEFPQGYNTNYELVIDPRVVFSTYSGATGGGAFSHSSTCDNIGNMYAMAQTFGIGWPTTLGAYQVNYGGGAADVGINKYSVDGTRL